MMQQSEQINWLFLQGCHCHLGNILYIVCKVFLRGFKVYFYLKIKYIMCNLADVTHSTADSKRSATDIMQVAADILPKTHFGLFKGEKYTFLVSAQKEVTSTLRGAQTQK